MSRHFSLAHLLAVVTVCALAASYGPGWAVLATVPLMACASLVSER